MEFKVRCWSCGETKPETEFYKDKSRKRSYARRCKHCETLKSRTPEQRKRTNEWRKKNRYDSKGIGRIIRNTKWLVFSAVKRGILKRMPCKVCGNPKVEGHHEDYNKPLVVEWLCNLHHRKKHFGKKLEAKNV